MGCKRVLPSNDFYPALTKPNVMLVTDGVTSITKDAVVTADGTQHPVDAIILGTGFHVTDNPMARLVHGRDGHRLSEVYQGDTPAYLGSTVPNFPNLVMMTGPNTGLGHTSMVFMIESQLNYVCDALRRLDATGMDAFEVRSEVASAYNAELQAKLPGTVWGSGCASGIWTRTAATSPSGRASPSPTAAGPAGWTRPTTSSLGAAGARRNQWLRPRPRGRKPPDCHPRRANPGDDFGPPAMSIYVWLSIRTLAAPARF